VLVEAKSDVARKVPAKRPNRCKSFI